MKKQQNKSEIQSLQTIYNSLPKINCKKLCHECCGPIAMSKIEHDRILKESGKVPTYDKKRQACGFLNKQNECKVYRIRPFICRLFGLVKAMKCPHGCEPERWLTDQEARQLLNQIEILSKNKGPIPTF